MTIRVILVLALLLSLKAVWDDRHEKRRRYERIAASFGKPAYREYKDGEQGCIKQYYEHHKEGFQIDDITWNDLDMDAVFQFMNRTESSAGQEYLYYMLRTPVFEKEELDKREAAITFFLNNPEERKKLQILFAKAGRTGKYSIYEYLEFLDVLEKGGILKEILTDLLYLVCLLVLCFNTLYGMVVLIALCGYQIASYLKKKRETEPFLISFFYLFRSIRLGEGLYKTVPDEFEAEKERLKTILKNFSILKKSANLGMRNMGGSGNPLEIVTDYTNMLFHFDLIGFQIMLGQVQGKKELIDELMTIAGRVEALLAAASFRESLSNGFCVPCLYTEDKTSQKKEKHLQARQIYHPLLSEPVKNSIHAKKGVLLTGSNASGKSTFLKTVAVNAILAQTVHTCCAEQYESSSFRVLTSMALRDDLGSGESYYIVEIKSMKRILDLAGSQDNILCFVDEVLRGTNTVERISASVQILKSLSARGTICFAATHDIELTSLLEKEYDNYHFEEEISEGDVFFSYQLKDGKAASRNAIRLLSVMGYEDELIEEAEKMAGHFLQTGSWEC